MSRPRRVTSGTWRGLPPSSRADLYASERVHAAAKAISPHFRAAGIELAGDAERSLRATLSAVMREAFEAGTERETALEMRADHEHRLRLLYERALREAGITPPRLTD